MVSGVTESSQVSRVSTESSWKHDLVVLMSPLNNAESLLPLRSRNILLKQDWLLLKQKGGF